MATIINADTSNGLKLTSDTSGEIQLQSAGTTIATVSSTGIAMASGKLLASTGPSFKAVMSAVTAISNVGATKLVLNTEEWDTNSNYDTANYRFTPTVAGYYSLTGSMFVSAATTSRVGVAIYKNGSEYAWQFMSGVTSAGGANPQVSTIAYANGSTDYFELYAAQNSSSSINAASNSVITWFSGALVRSA